MVQPRKKVATATAHPPPNPAVGAALEALDAIKKAPRRGRSGVTDEQRMAEAGLAIAAAIHEYAAATREQTDAIRPAVDFFEGAGHRLDALCRWLKRWLPWLLGLLPAVLTAIGAISPNAAAALKVFLTTHGG